MSNKWLLDASPLILLAKVRGLIPAAKPVCDDLEGAGLRIHPTGLRDALKLVGE